MYFISHTTYGRTVLKDYIYCTVNNSDVETLKGKQAYFVAFLIDISLNSV